MNITLRAGERFFINGAVIRIDRKASIELLNEVTFLLENHVMQAEEAATLVRQIYFAVQIMLMDPTAAPSAASEPSTTGNFTHTVGEFGVVLMIGGGIPGVTKTLSISIYDQVQDFAYAQANHTALLLLSLSFLALLIIYGRRGRAGV